MRQQAFTVFDFIRYDIMRELKMNTFNPDVIFVVQKENSSLNLKESIQKMLNRTIPAHCTPADRKSVLNIFLINLYDITSL